MILQALKGYYDRKSALGDGSLPKEGWIRRGVDYVLVLDQEGNCLDISPMGKLEKGKTVSREMLLPAIGKQALKHTNSGEDANLLWDNASFVFGTGNKGAKKLASFMATLNRWLEDTQDEGLIAVKRFCLALQSQPDSLGLLLEKFKVAGDFEKRDPTLVFRLISDIEEIHARPAIRSCYENKILTTESKTRGSCLVTGCEDVPLVSNEIVIKGVWGGQPAGCNIVSFNKDSFISYGKRELKKRGENAPIGIAASFAYTTALNHLLSVDRQRVQIGDASTVFWAEERHEMEDLFGELIRDNPDIGTGALKALYKAVQTGKFSIGDSTSRFHVLGLAPNAARISIRFWETGTAYELACRLKRHFDDIKIVKADYDPEHISLSAILKASSMRKPDGSYNTPPNLGAEILRAIIEDLPYPPILLSAVLQRCKSEQAQKNPTTGKPLRNVSYRRAAIIKAYLNQLNRFRTVLNKEITVPLDHLNKDPAYRLGRLFAVFERVQEVASERELNRTIRDTYFSSAMTTPRSVFARLIQLNQHHLRDIRRRSPEKAGYFDNIIRDINWELDATKPNETFPIHLSMEGQGIFALGYYQQRQDLFPKPTTPKTQQQNGEPK